jgi:hypothetical protein
MKSSDHSSWDVAPAGTALLMLELSTMAASQPAEPSVLTDRPDIILSKEWFSSLDL